MDKARDIFRASEDTASLDAMYLAAVRQAQRALFALELEHHEAVRRQLSNELDMALELLRAAAASGHVHSRTALSFLGSRDGEMSARFLRQPPGQTGASAEPAAKDNAAADGDRPAETERRCSTTPVQSTPAAPEPTTPEPARTVAE